MSVDELYCSKNELAEVNSENSLHIELIEAAKNRINKTRTYKSTLPLLNNKTMHQ